MPIRWSGVVPSPPMASQIKGLSQFIADLRSSNSAEAERARVQTELASLRKKLAQARGGGKDLGSKAKNGYEHRKVVSKLLYIYILGYDVDLGTEEILTLVQMPKFAEKQVGYLALGMLLGTREDLRETIEPALIADLRSPKESLTSLALNYVSSCDPQQPVSTALLDLVYQLMVSPTSSSAVVKKAALCYMHYFKYQPERFMVDKEEWRERVERITAILAGPNLGVSTSVVSLLIQIAQLAPESFGEHTLRIVSHKLTDVFEETPDDSQEYAYYNITAPWLLVKLCKLLQLLPVNGDQVYDLRRTIAPVLSYCVEDAAGNGESGNNNAQHKNARNFVLFEVVRLANQLSLSEWDYDLSLAVLAQIKHFLTDKDTTLRYLALQALQSFPTPHPGPSDNELLAQVLRLVRDRDISVRRQAIDALYVLVDSQTVETVAAELLDLLVASDLQIRAQMVARLAALIERFATSHEWYFDTCISLLVIGGGYAGDEVWQRLVQVVVNNQALHSYAVKRVYETITSHGKSIHSSSASNGVHSEALVKVAAFVLGEFTPLYQGDPVDLFVALQDRINAMSWSTQVMMLTTYAKLAARYPHLRPAVAETMAIYCNAPHVETQQRATEYSLLLLPENTDLLAMLVEPMPPFGETTSWELFTKSLQPQKTVPSGMQPPLEPTRTVSGASTASNWPAFANSSNLPINPTGVKGTHTGFSQAGVDHTRGPTSRSSSVSKTPSATPLSETGSPLKSTPTGSATLSSNWEYGFKRMLTQPEAVLYQDAILQVGCRYEFRQSKGSVVLYLRNISSFDVASLFVQLNNPMSDDILQLKLEHARNAGGTLHAGEIAEYVVRCEAKQPFALAPTCRITFLAGSLMEISLKLPIVLERFMSPSEISAEEFQQRWEQLGPQLEFQKTFRNVSTSNTSKTVEDDFEIVRGMQYGIVAGSPPPTVFGAGIIHTTNGGMYGSLIVLQPDATRKNYKVTVRTTRKKIAAVVLTNNIAQAYHL